MPPITYSTQNNGSGATDTHACYADIATITEEQQLQTLKELQDYKYALDETSIVSITDEHGIIKHVNARFCEVSCYAAHELLGKDHRIINAGYHGKDFFRQLWQTISRGEIWKGEIKNRKKNGSLYWVDTVIIPFINEQGHPYQYLSIRNDITEKIAIKEKAIENERFIKAITDNVPAMIGYWTKEQNCLFANDAYKKWFGKKYDEDITGTNKKDLISEDEYSRHLPHILAVLNGSPQTFERSFIQPDGSVSFANCQYVPDIQDGVVKGFYSLINDITAQKKAELEVKLKTDQIESILNILDDGFISFNEHNECIYANKKAKEIFPLPNNLITDLTSEVLFPGDPASSITEAVQKIIEGNKLVANEHYNSKLAIWQENRIYPTGKGISILVRDITERINTEKKYKEFNERVSLISKTINDALFEWNFETNELWWSDSHYILFGFNPNGPMPTQEQWFEKIHPESRIMLQDIVNKALHYGIEEWQQEINFFKPDGSSGTLYNRGFVVRNAAGQATRLMGSFIDITDRKNADNEKALLADLSAAFTQKKNLSESLEQVVKKLGKHGHFSFSEMWMVAREKTRINLVAIHADEHTKNFHNVCSHISYVKKGESFPGIVWKTKKTQIWHNIQDCKEFVRREAAVEAGIKTVIGVPMIAGNEVIGVLLLGMKTDNPEYYLYSSSLFQRISSQIGNEIQRKQLEEELFQIVNFAPDVICIYGIDGQLKKVNPAMCQLLEYEEEEILTKNVFDLIHPDDIDKSNAELLKQERGESTHYFENRLITSSGKVKWFAWTSTPVIRAGLIYSVAKEITREKELKQLLQKANTLARIGEWEVYLTTKTAYWSRIAKEIHEVDAAYIPEVNSLNSFYGDAVEGSHFAELLANAMLSKAAFDQELQIVTAKGNKKWIRVIGEPEFVNGVCVRLYGSFQDIDSRKKAEVTATQALEERNLILESIGDAFFAVDKNWKVTYWNKVAEKVLGKTRQQMLDNNLWDVFKDAVGSQSYQQYHKAISTNEAVHFEDYYPPYNAWFEISAYPAHNGLTVYFKDVTERKVHEQTLTKLNQDLEKHTKELMVSNAELEQFAYIASHDLQEPLRMITSFLTQIEKKYNEILDERGRKYIHFAVDGAMRMRQIILDLLEFSRVGKQQQNMQSVDTLELVAEIKSMYKKSINEQKAVLHVHHLPVITAAKAPVRQVFQNIISNSIKYHAQGTPPEIHISCTENAAEWHFSIADNGIGIDPQYFDTIFIIFQRLHNRDEYTGTGMGLAVAKKTIENMGGEIWVDSELGKGSTFHFTVLKPTIQ